MKPSTVLLIFSSIVFVSCTREVADVARVSLHVPNSAEVFAKGVVPHSKLGAFSVMSKWALPQAVSFSEINCFAVMVNAPEASAPVANTCADIDGNVKAQPQFIQGGFLPGTNQVIEVPSGTARTIYLVGFRASSPAFCTDVSVNKFKSAEFSPPVILAQSTVDLKAGDVSVDMTPSAALSGASQFEDCAPAFFSTDVAPSEPTAIIDSTGINAVNNLSAFSFPVGGAYTFEYQKALVFNGAGNCSDAVWDNIYFPRTTNAVVSLSLSPSSDGNYDLCIKARSASGVVQSAPSRFSWVRDTVAPTSTPMFTMAAIGNDTTPDVNVTFVPPGTAEIRFYTTFGCSGGYVSRNPITQPGVVTMTTQLPGNNNYYARVYDSANNGGFCTSTAQNYKLDTMPPSAPVALAARFGVSTEYTPYFTWGTAQETGYSAGISDYQVALGTSTLSDLMPWQSLGGAGFSTFTSLAGFYQASRTYYFSVRAVDAAGNIGQTATQSFTVNEAASFTQQAFVKGSPSLAGDDFGNAVAVEADTMVVGAASADNTMANSGAVSVYARLGNSWTKTATILAVDQNAYDNFGTSVAISGDTIVVGAPYESSNLAGNSLPLIGSTDTSSPGNGAVYVYRRDILGVWNIEAYLKAPVASNYGYFGTSVAIDGNVIAVGAPGTNSNTGKVFTFIRTGTTWTNFSGLVASDAAPQAQFGAAVSISGNTLAVGAPNQQGAGAVYIFNNSSGFTQNQLITPVMAARTTGDQFGKSLQLFGTLLVIGSPGEDSYQSTVTSSAATMNESAPDSGAVHVYRQSGGSYALEKFLKAPNNRYNNKFGNSVGVWGTTIVVGAPGESDCNSLPSYPGDSFGSTYSCNNSGGVYIFQGSVLANWHWTNFFKPTFNWSSNPAGIGTSIAISGSTVVSGAIGEASAGSGVLNGPLADSTTTATVAPSGAVYIFDVYVSPAQAPTLGAVPPVAL